MKSNNNEAVAGLKEKMKQRLWDISSLCALKLIYVIQLSGLFIMFIPQAVYYGDPRTAYAFVLIAAYPAALAFLTSSSKSPHTRQDTEEILPVLSSRVKYSKEGYTVWSRSFVLQTITFLLYQYSNSLIPYDSLLLQYGPVILAAFSLVLRLLAPFLFRWRFHRTLLGGL